MSEPTWSDILNLLSTVIVKHGEEKGAKALECFQKIYHILESEDEAVREAVLEMFLKAAAMARK